MNAPATQVADAPHPRHKIDSIQVLRGLAACAVVIAHISTESAHTFHVRELPLASYGINGVDIFFIISGFIMYFTTVNTAKPFKPGDFLVRRFIRVAPTYWLYSAVLFGLFLALPRLFARARLTVGDLLQSFAFLPHYNAIGELSPVIAAGWTLNFEIFFYLMFCVVRSRTRAILWPLALLFAGLVGLGLVLRLADPAYRSFTNPLLFEFLFGLAIARLFLEERRLPALPSTVLIVVGLALSWYLPAVMPENGAASTLDRWRWIARGAPSMLIVLALACGRISEAWRPKPLLFLGDISYSLYLTHTLTLRVLFALFKRMSASETTALALDALALVLCIGAAAITYQLIEKPLTLALTTAYLRLTAAGSVWRAAD